MEQSKIIDTMGTYHPAHLEALYSHGDGHLETMQQGLVFGYIVGLYLIFFFCKTLKQAKNSNLDWAFGLVG